MGNYIRVGTDSNNRTSGVITMFFCGIDFYQIKNDVN